MDTTLTVKEPETTVHVHTLSTNSESRKGQHTKYLDKEYIVRAREAEVKHHLHSIGQLQKKMEKLANELAWELEQHHSKIHELYQLERPFRKDQEKTAGRVTRKKKISSQAKPHQALDIPVFGEAICESVA